jgi:hypothetical protein
MGQKQPTRTQFTPEEDPGDETEEREEPAELPNRDLPGTAALAADIKLMNVYGDYIHQNDGMHLDGGIANNPMCQERWANVLSCQPNATRPQEPRSISQLMISSTAGQGAGGNMGLEVEF